eukprot:TRINITY_DN48003_c0_g1_i1.p1 TRINITY_DN48003_c0_g1~~TRINITY_DN48003_c0_g1_i1.p1  ORF type:complete len:158 (+),score=39.48 TRINITY_DN48003_c0_g1_i1:78-551(+)
MVPDDAHEALRRYEVDCAALAARVAALERSCWSENAQKQPKRASASLRLSERCAESAPSRPQQKPAAECGLTFELSRLPRRRVFSTPGPAVSLRPSLLLSLREEVERARGEVECFTVRLVKKPSTSSGSFNAGGSHSASVSSAESCSDPCGFSRMQP